MRRTSGEICGCGGSVGYPQRRVEHGAGRGAGRDSGPGVQVFPRELDGRGYPRAACDMVSERGERKVNQDDGGWRSSAF